ncbi:MAG: twin-arginine translocase TatA/TatE family subunit [Gammaproteobacteria bacterium]|jgi:sec-independent protein translocase protein TatB|nr:twin-arginine translocase TatA/TatE family subunit [Gammaproteobacteria bacterium]
MFEIGFWELALLFGLGLIVLGPEKLPKIADQLGRYAGQARRMARNFSEQIRDEIEAEARRAASTPQNTASGAEQNPPAFSRPGAADLIPKTTEPPSTAEAAEELAAEALAANTAAAESPPDQLPPHG